MRRHESAGVPKPPCGAHSLEESVAIDARCALNSISAAPPAPVKSAEVVRAFEAMLPHRPAQ